MSNNGICSRKVNHSARGGISSEGARTLAARAIVNDWTRVQVSRGSFPEDHSDGFDHMDATGSGIDGLVFRFYGDTSDLHEAPCGNCPLDCPGAIGPCFLNDDSGALLGREVCAEGEPGDSGEDYSMYAEAA